MSSSVETRQMSPQQSSVLSQQQTSVGRPQPQKKTPLKYKHGLTSPSGDGVIFAVEEVNPGGRWFSFAVGHLSSALTPLHDTNYPDLASDPDLQSA